MSKPQGKVRLPCPEVHWCWQFRLPLHMGGSQVTRSAIETMCQARHKHTGQPLSDVEITQQVSALQAAAGHQACLLPHPANPKP